MQSSRVMQWKTYTQTKQTGRLSWTVDPINTLNPVVTNAMRMYVLECFYAALLESKGPRYSSDLLSDGVCLELVARSPVCLAGQAKRL